MGQLRIKNHPILSIDQDRQEINFTFDGKVLSGYQGDTIASALLANNIRTLRHHEETESPRGIYCNIGHCFECRVTINEHHVQRACLTELAEGMTIQSGKRLPAPFKEGVYHE
ncbi:(2Fe-2S)-binding protein [Sediminibacillus massiliensis]|uniref:(2Fe-2S)-binding protein n=1 Tax=Sediminibacillus massiliensis TaxID=1926277 RepID=UPI0009884B04|nr:(2Fe-2S)-binding protein [Sediminibacillus massiliensis]